MTDDKDTPIQDGRPVMCCHPTPGGDPTQLVRGDAPSTPKIGETEHTSTEEQAKPERRSVKRFFRVTPKESKRIDARAEEQGLEPSSYMRAQCLGKAVLRACKRVRVDLKMLAHYLGKINQAGNVVNQLLLRLWKTNGSDVPEEVRRALIELERAAHAITLLMKGK